MCLDLTDNFGQYLSKTRIIQANMQWKFVFTNCWVIDLVLTTKISGNYFFYILWLKCLTIWNSIVSKYGNWLLVVVFKIPKLIQIVQKIVLTNWPNADQSFWAFKTSQSRTLPAQRFKVLKRRRSAFIFAVHFNRLSI